MRQQASEPCRRKFLERVLAIATVWHPGRNDAERARALAANRRQQVEVVAHGESEAPAHGLACAPLRQEVSKPGGRFGPGPGGDAEWQANRERECVRGGQPARIVLKAEVTTARRPNPPDPLLAEPHAECATHGRCPRGTIQTSSPSRPRTWRTSPRRSVAFPRSNSPRNRTPTPERPAVSV